MHYPSSSRFAVSSGLRTATSAFPVLSLPPDLSASAAGYATVLPVRVTRYHQPRVARDDGRRGVPRRGLSLLGWTVPTTTPEDRAEPATEVKHPPSFRFKQSQTSTHPHSSHNPPKNSRAANLTDTFLLSVVDPSRSLLLEKSTRSKEALPLCRHNNINNKINEVATTQ
jgi:hypothetical protein